MYKQYTFSIMIGVFFLVLLNTTRVFAINWDSVRNNNQNSLVYIRSELHHSNGLIQTIEGTGFLVHSDGWILTCAHVVPEASSDETVTYLVAIGGRGEFQRQARVRRRDKNKDLALLLLEHQAAAPLPSVDLDFDWSIRPDQLVYTLGFPSANPYGIDGVEGRIRGQYEELWFTDASINPGNSGGPVFNQEGRVIAVAKGARSDADQMNVVVPIRLAINWFEELGIRGNHHNDGLQITGTQDYSVAKFSITLGWQLGRFEFVDGSPFPEAQRIGPQLKQQINQLLNQDGFPYKITDYNSRQIIDSVLQYYGTTDLKKHAFILLGIGAMRASLIGASADSANNQEIKNLAVSAIMSIDSTIVQEREQLAEKLILAAPANVADVLQFLKEY